MDAPNTEAKTLYSAGRDSLARYQSSHSLHDLDDAVGKLQRAIELAPDESTKAAYLSYLNNLLSMRFMAKGDVADINSAVDSGIAAVEAVPDTSTEKPALLANLGNALRQRFSRLGDISDVDRAVEAYRRAFELAQYEDERLPYFILNFGLTLRTRFDVTGRLGDLEMAISSIRQSLVSIPPESIHHATCLNNLGLCLMRLFERSLDPQDIDEAVEKCKLAVQQTLDEDLRKSARWHTLAMALDARSTWLNLNDIEDLDAAVYAAERAVSALPNGAIEKPTCLNTLCLALRRRLQTTHRRSDMDDMISAQQKAVQLCPGDSPRRAMFLDTFGIVLLDKYRETHDVAILDAAVNAAQQAVEYSTAADSHQGWRLFHMAIALEERFYLSKQRADIDLAISVTVSAINTVLPEDVFRGTSFQLLAHLLYFKHDILGDPLDVDTMITALEVVARSPGTARARFIGAQSWATALRDHRGLTASVDAWKLVIELIPSLLWIGARVEDDHTVHFLQVVEQTLPGAIEAALASDDGAVIGYAVEWLEEGRSIVWGQYDDLRAPLDLIRESDARLAEELEMVSKRLASFDVDESPIPSSGIQSLSLLDPARADTGPARRALAQKFERLVNQARQLPRCAGFLHQKSLADLQPAGTHTPIVMLQQHDTFCRVVVQLPPGSQFYSFEVPFTLQMAERARDAVHGSLQTAPIRGGSRASFNVSTTTSQRRCIFERALRVIWIELVRPILDRIKPRLKSASPGELPRVTWSPTGILAFLPFHAAGDYVGETPEAIYDRVVSSYTPNLTVLVNGVQRQKSGLNDLSAKPTPRILGISQPDTPGQPSLPGTRVEIQKLAETTSNLTWLDGETATRRTVLEHMKQHAWVHLACHGVQDPKRFTDSAFMLHDGPLRLKDIMAQSFQHTQFAFLSACQTATGDRRFPNENLHLAAGLLHAGFGSVCSTMWSIQDEDGPVVSEQFYASLFGDGGDVQRSAYALHKAVAHLRERVGVKEFVRWVPFIHFGL
ncbi:unnamed protein product [Peniophora sp. CBMAI 1063]|nr:unnamed protein product [Peniophora sp. CBMAI 1063]